MSPTEIKILMQKYGISPKKLFGQNFLISEGILDKIVESSNIDRGDVVLEVGPGLGALTLKLAKKAKQVIAVEKDRVLVNILREQITERGIDNIQIIEGDVMKFLIPNSQFLNNLQNQNFQISNYKLIANIPYYLTSALIRKFLESETKPQKIVLMIQKEVAQRICLPRRSLGGGGRHQQIKMNILALSVQFYADAKILFYVSKENFWPAPKVDSAVIEISPKKELPDIDEKSFFKVVKAGFANKRKQLAGNLSTNLGISKERAEEILTGIGINPKQRAEELDLEKWLKLTKLLS